ncbi:MAG TPA: hypothetical protein VEB59_08690 [Gemmatimonadales bacterium]|nr:hypothetical protein [Gemmatimonadales bacterium]
MRTRFPRRRLLAALLLLGGVPACGDESGPIPRLYAMTAVQVSTETLADGTIRNRYQLTVTEGNLRVAGAWMRFATDAGDASPPTDRTDINGNGVVEWTLETADYAGLSQATLSGCAQDLAPPDCTPQPLITLAFD